MIRAVSIFLDDFSSLSEEMENVYLYDVTVKFAGFDEFYSGRVMTDDLLNDGFFPVTVPGEYNA